MTITLHTFVKKANRLLDNQPAQLRVVQKPLDFLSSPLPSSFSVLLQPRLSVRLPIQKGWIFLYIRSALFGARHERTLVYGLRWRGLDGLRRVAQVTLSCCLIRSAPASTARSALYGARLERTLWSSECTSVNCKVCAVWRTSRIAIFRVQRKRGLV